MTAFNDPQFLVFMPWNCSPTLNRTSFLLFWITCSLWGKWVLMSWGLSDNSKEGSYQQPLEWDIWKQILWLQSSLQMILVLTSGLQPHERPQANGIPFPKGLTHGNYVKQYMFIACFKLLRLEVIYCTLIDSTTLVLFSPLPLGKIWGTYKLYVCGALGQLKN